MDRGGRLGDRGGRARPPADRQAAARAAAGGAGRAGRGGVRVNGAALLMAVVLLFVNGWFVAVEFALISARRTKLEEEHLQGSRAAGVAMGLVDELSVQLAGAQLGVTI